MALSIEWRRRINNFQTTLKSLVYTSCGKVDFKGFVTLEQLAPEEAILRAFQPMPTGTEWGAKWEYGWFLGEVVLPDDASGKRIVLRLDLGGEALVWVNGELVGSRDYAHSELTLTMPGVAGKRFSILAEAYAGHGTITVGGEPVPYGVETVPEPGPKQTQVGESTYGAWDEDIYQLNIDLTTLLELRDNLDPFSLRVAEIDRGLMDLTLITDPELPRQEMLATVKAGRKRLRPLLDCVNGTTMPTMYAFGHAHLDVAWLWPLQETERKIARTVSNQLALMDEYPEFTYFQSQPHLFTMLKQFYPDVYAKFKEKVAKGNIIVEGASWVEPDTNLSGGESLIRQFLYGKQFFKDEFGVDSVLFWEPDVFGYSGALPQIMKGCGVKYFATAKLTWVYNGGDPFPYNLFIWQGIDGSEILAHVFHGYGNYPSPESLIHNWNERLQKMDTFGQLMGFGFGDGGGGATRDHLEFLKREENLEGVPRVKFASPVQFFKDAEMRGLPRVRYVGELYYSCHRGTYTSQARTKLSNRKSEFILRDAELWGSAAQAFGQYQFPSAEIHDAWQTVLLNQFHDVIPGSSIARVYEEAELSYRQVQEAAQNVITRAVSNFIKSGSEVAVFNSLSWPRTVIIPMPAGIAEAYSIAGDMLASQTIDGKVYVEAKVPACGWTTLTTKTVSGTGSLIPKGIKTVPLGSERFVMARVDERSGAQIIRPQLENEFLRVEFNDIGEIISLLDKSTNRELTSGLCNAFKMYKDVPTWFDAWDIDSMTTDAPVELLRQAEVELVSAGPLVGILRLKRKLNQSTLVQEISLRRGSRRIDFKTTIDWQERHKLLKVAFPMDIHTNEAIHEIQFGHIRRPNHSSRPHDADRFEVSNHKWTAIVEENRGAAVLNDCKYGLSVTGKSINLTLLKSAIAPDMKADQGIQTFTYSLYTWNGSLADSPLIQEAYDLNIPVQVFNGNAGETSIFSVSTPNIVIEAVKPAEDGSGDVIVRVYESKRMATRCILTTTLPIESASLTNMLEEGEGDLMFENGHVGLDFRAFEIKTIRLRIAR
jgi:alpha-mannosidase